MTVCECYEYALIECNKLKAPSLLIEDYNYLFNKAIQQYVNSVYNRCEYNQQSSDDLRVLQEKKKLVRNENGKFDLPEDYLHLLNCKATFSVSNNFCDKVNNRKQTIACSRLTADLDAGILENYYMKPSAKRPYYYINDTSIDIYAGEDESSIDHIEITYIRTPKEVVLTYDAAYSDETINNSQEGKIVDNEELEFPNYVCYEIINLFVKLLLENASDPRMNTHIPINQTIAIPGSN